MLLRVFGITALALMVTAATAVATPIHDAAVIDIPYAVQIHGKMIPPGEYLVRDVTVGGHDTDVLDIYKAGGQELVASVQTQPAFRVNPTATNEVETGETANGTHYLQKIWLGTRYWGFDIPKTAMN